MNVNFLPDKIRKLLGDKFAGRIPVSIVRTGSAADGQAGEGYVVGFDDKVLFFSRKLGEDSFSLTGENLGNSINSLNIRKEKYDTFLDMDVMGRPCSVKVSLLDSKELQILCDKFKLSAGPGGVSIGKAEPAAAPAKTETKAPAEPPRKEHASYLSTRPSSQPQQGQSSQKISPQTALAVSLMFVASVDRKVAPEENTYIGAIFKNSAAALKAALGIYRTTPYDSFLKMIGHNLSDEQKTCILANMIDLAMTDGTYGSDEQELVEKFVSAMGIQGTTYTSIMNAMLAKNNVSVLSL